MKIDWSTAVAAVTGRPEVHAAFRRIDGMLEELAAETTAICEIPAPPFKEHARARFVAGLMERYGLTGVRVDETPNVTGLYPAAGGREGEALLLAAHIDTVFPEGTDCTVRRTGNTLTAPGVSDNSANVAAILAVARLLREFHFELPHEVFFVGTAGEEGLGDLRGMKQAMRDLGGAARFILPVDGAFGSICHRAVGSRRLRVHVSTGGGHSYAAFGVPSAIHGLGRMIAAIARVQVPKSPKTTFNVGVIGGGTSVNTIAAKAWMEVDMRSESAAELAGVEETVRALIDAGAKAEKVDYAIDVVGSRAAGEIPATAEVVSMLSAVYRHFGIEPALRSGSTDANVPIGMGLQAATISAKSGSNGHTVRDSVDLESMIPGVKSLLTVVLVATGWGR